MKLQLTRPIKTEDGKTLTHLEVRDYVTGGDILRMRKSANDEVERDYHLLKDLCGLTMAEFLDLDVRDIKAIDNHCLSIMSPKESVPPETKSQK